MELTLIRTAPGKDKRKSEGFISAFDRNAENLQDLINKLREITDRMEEVHRKATIGSLSGRSIRAAGGITTAVGVALAPVTMGASLVATQVGISVATAGGITGAASNITDRIKQKTLRKEIEETLDSIQNQLNPIIEKLVEIETEMNNLDSNPGPLGISTLDITQIIQRASTANIRPATEQVSRTVKKAQ
uniref:Apolipo L3-like protein n=1 Tax=Astyanax mexicanus TaxID=7994 RepID=A0A3B1JIJ2_ASTMX